MEKKGIQVEKPGFGSRLRSVSSVYPNGSLPAASVKTAHAETQTPRTIFLIMFFTILSIFLVLFFILYLPSCFDRGQNGDGFCEMKDAR